MERTLCSVFLSAGPLGRDVCSGYVWHMCPQLWPEVGWDSGGNGGTGLGGCGSQRSHQGGTTGGLAPLLSPPRQEPGLHVISLNSWIYAANIYLVPVPGQRGGVGRQGERQTQFQVSRCAPTRCWRDKEMASRSSQGRSTAGTDKGPESGWGGSQGTHLGGLCAG